MNKTILAAAVISGFLMASCGGSDSPEFDRSIGPVDTTTKAVAMPANTAQPATVPANLQVPSTGSQTQSVQVQPQQAVQTVTPPPAPSTTAKGMNPPHGQPGHRCDIAVGAPLNSAPAAKPQVSTTTTTPQVVSAPAQATATPAATPTVTAPGMNPPHGQPGHDCSIAVGAPLKKTN